MNYRGSSGYGKSFLHKGDKGWGIGPMQHDLSDAVAWAVEQGIAVEEKVGTCGGPYTVDPLGLFGWLVCTTVCTTAAGAW